MTSQIATHKDTGIVTESELAQRKRDIRGRSAGWSPDADKGFDLSDAGEDKAELPTTEKKFAITELVEKFIRKKGSQFCVVSHSGKNLGCSPSKGGAEKRLAQVEYFKHKKSLAEDLVVKSLDVGELTVMDDELAKFVAYQNYVYAKSLFAKHLPGKHDQDDHAGVKGAAGKVSHTPAQIREAAARQYAKDEAVSIAEARKKVTNGAHVPTTKLMQLRSEKEALDKKIAALKKLRREGVGTYLGGASKDFEENKSLVVKADQACLKSIWEQAYKYYTGKWIAAAQQFVLKQDWERAALAMAKARDGYQEEKNPKEWGCLDAWRQFYRDKVEGGE